MWESWLVSSVVSRHFLLSDYCDTTGVADETDAVVGADQSNICFAIDQGTLPWQTIPILKAKSAKFAYPPSFVAVTFRNGLEYRKSDWHINSGDDLPISCRNLVSVGPANSGVYEAQLHIAGIDKHSGYFIATFSRRRHCGISTRF